jgi:hypothetical protein
LGGKPEHSRAFEANNDETHSDFVHPFFDQHTIIELNGLNESVKTFLCSVLFLWVYHAALAKGPSKHPRLVLVIEEAHHLLFRGQRGSESVIERFLRLAREFGLAVVLVDQSPSQLSQTALANTFATIALNVREPADVTRVAALTGLGDQDKHHLAGLPVGHAVVRLADRYRRPFLVRVPELRGSGSRLTDKELEARLLQQRLAGSHRIRPREHKSKRVRQIRTPDTVGNPDAFQLMHDITAHPIDGVKQRYNRLGWSMDKGNRIKTALIHSNYLRAEHVTTGRTRRVLLEPTRTGARTFRMQPAGQGHASIVHEYWKHQIADQYRAQGYRVQLESPRQTRGYVDILASKGNERIAIEIETGKSEVASNVRANLASGFTRIVVAATNHVARRLIANRLVATGLVVPGRLTIVLAHEHLVDGGSGSGTK